MVGSHYTGYFPCVHWSLLLEPVAPPDPHLPSSLRTDHLFAICLLYLGLMTDSLTALISISPPFPAFPPFAGLSQVSLQSMCHDMCVYLHVDSEHQVPCIFLSSCTWLCVLFSWQSSLLS